LAYVKIYGVPDYYLGGGGGARATFNRVSRFVVLGMPGTLQAAAARVPGGCKTHIATLPV